MKLWSEAKFHARFHIARLWLVLAALLAATGLAAAHPHVLVSVEAAIMIDGQGNITGVRHAWTFDEAYTALAVLGMKSDKDGRISREALTDLTKLNIESLKDWRYFTALKQGRKLLEFNDPPDDYYQEHDGKSLTLHFILPLKNPVPAAKTMQLEVQDDNFYVAFSFADKNPVRIEGGGANCRIEMKLPGKSLNTGELSKMGEGFFNNLQPGFADQYASYARLICP